jgi:hypothetical protein
MCAYDTCSGSNTAMTVTDGPPIGTTAARRLQRVRRGTGVSCTLICHASYCETIYVFVCGGQFKQECELARICRCQCWHVVVCDDVHASFASQSKHSCASYTLTFDFCVIISVRNVAYLVNDSFRSQPAQAGTESEMTSRCCSRKSAVNSRQLSQHLMNETDTL